MQDLLAPRSYKHTLLISPKVYEMRRGTRLGFYVRDKMRSGRPDNQSDNLKLSLLYS